MENEHTALTDTTMTTTITTEKKRYTPLVVFFTFAITLLLGLALLYAGSPIRRRSSLAAGVGGTTIGGACVVSVGSFVSSQDFCFACGHGTLFGYCWNSQPCPPKCDDARGVAGKMECEGACKIFEEVGY